jgi:hypothetical protein
MPVPNDPQLQGGLHTLRDRYLGPWYGEAVAKYGNTAAGTEHLYSDVISMLGETPDPKRYPKSRAAHKHCVSIKQWYRNRKQALNL